MVTLDEFLKIEINSVTKKRILDAIAELQNLNSEVHREFTFNIYSIILRAKEKRALISNDILPEFPDVDISFDEFRDLLINFRTSS
jgi:hypothetical protein